MLEDIAKMLGEQLDVDPATITADTDIIKDLGADSLDVVELLISLEDEFGVSIPEDDIVNVKTVGDIVAMLEKLEK